MLTISKPLSAGQAQTYHKEEFANAEENYYSEGDRIRGEWHGRLAQEWGLQGQVQEEHFQRLANGQHPLTEEVRWLAQWSTVPLGTRRSRLPRAFL
jgi:conjugative relaxase-like TrwC/TraI family protein